MQSSALWSLLNALRPAALRDIGKMTASPYFNKRADVAALFEELNRCYASTVCPHNATLKIFPASDAAALRLTMHFRPAHSGIFSTPTIALWCSV